MTQTLNFEVCYANRRNKQLWGSSGNYVLCEVPKPALVLKDCDALRSRFPAGLTGYAASAKDIARRGWMEPAVDLAWFGANSARETLWGRDGDQDVLCEVLQVQYDFADCAALNAVYPGGVVKYEFQAGAWERRGFVKPEVSALVFDIYEKKKDFWGDDKDPEVLCEQPKPAVPPTQVTGLFLGSYSSSGPLCQVYVSWKDDTGAFPEARYDVYVNGVLVKESESLWFGSVPVAPESSFTVEVVAHNSAGRAPAARVSGVAPQIERCRGLKRVVYSITGTAPSVDVTLENDSGGTEQHSDVVNPIYSFWMQPGDFVYISARNNGNSGTVTCTIMSNDRRVATSTSTGAYVSATCSGSA